MLDDDVQVSVPASAPAPRPQVAKVKRRSMFSDPTVRRMGFFALGLVIFYLAVILSALLSGVLNPQAPRTAAERDLSMARGKVEAGSRSERDWALYAQSLTDGKQYGRAQTVINQAKTAKINDPRNEHLLLAQTRLFYAQEEWDKAIKTASEGITKLEKQLKKDLEIQRQTGQATSMSAVGLGQNYYSMLSIKGLALEKQGKDQELLKTLNAYLKDKPRAADMLEWRGDVYVRLGDEAKAAADYKEAKRFTPGESPIDEKLEKLGVN